MRVHVVDPSAYTPPYDHALCAALARAGAQVDLYTSRFAYAPPASADGGWPPPDGYRRHDFFYRAALGAPSSGVRRASKLAQHVPDMLRYARAARAAEVVHFQWLPVQHVDPYLLPRGRPLVLTAHDVLPREPRRGQLAAQRRVYGRFDAVVVHSEHGGRRLTQEVGVDPGRVHVIRHGAFAHLAAGPRRPPPFQTDAPVVLCFGLLRPYKGVEVLLEAWRGVEDAELWIVGMPRMEMGRLRAAAGPSVRFVERFVPDAELAGCFARADVVVLPYLQADQSGVLYTALAFGRPLLLSDVGGFPEVAATGAARTVPAGDAVALRAALRELLGDPAARARMSERARAAAAGIYSWDRIAGRTLELYGTLTGRPHRGQLPEPSR